MHFDTENVVTCCVALVGQHGTTRASLTRHAGASRTTCVQRRRHSVDWGGYVHLTFSRSCSWDWCKSRTQL